MGAFARRFQPFYEQISNNIFQFCRALNFIPTWQQALLFKAVQDGKRRIAVKSGQGPGKTTATAVVGLWRALRNVNALGIITAPTMRQCKDVWLVEARRRMEIANPMLKKFVKITKTKIEIGGKPDWGIKLVTATREENAQGYHEEHMTVIGEEASGIPRELVTQFKGTLSNPDSLFILIGNPNTRDCAFFDCFNNLRHQWHCITFNAEETPTQIVHPQRNLDLEEEFGRDSDVYRIRVLGEFPFTDPNCVMSSEDLQKCSDPNDIIRCALLNRHADFGGGKARQFGIDFSRYGGDESCVYQRSGNAIVKWEKFSHTDPSDVCDIAFRMQHERKWKDNETLYVPDAGGMGQGIMHRFHKAHKDVIEFHNGGLAIDSEQFANKITEAWFHMARLVKGGDCNIPNDNRLIQQLSTRRYYTNRKGKLILETKDEFMKRGYESPDRGDGCVLAFYDQEIAQGRVMTRGSTKARPGIAARVA